MLVPVKWLNEYVNIEDLDIRELAERLTMTGSHVDSIINIDKGINNVVTAKIVDISQHPEADKLVVTKVDTGNDLIQIVTGAKNIKIGDIVPVALEGAVLADGLKIKKSKLRGIESFGMMCSYEELGVEDKLVPKESKNGILIFPQDVEPGKNAVDILNLKGHILDIEITFNRPDCLSILGIARETAATFGRNFTEPEICSENEQDDINDYVKSIEISDEDLCARYYAKVIKDVKIGPSPLWLQRKIMDAGMRPINNIVDATNYVMLEMGQPLHAFDLETMKERKVIVRRAKENEEIVTLDNENRKLDKDMLVIADADNAQCIAGVMGGLYSEISEKTKIILMESANFNPKSVRMTSKKLGLRSEASSRNEKSISPQMAAKANERVCRIIEKIGAGTVVKGSIDIYNGKNSQAKKVILRPSRCNKLLGTDIDNDTMVKILNNLSIKSKMEDDVIVSEIPDFRTDIEQEADLIEEVGRIYGFEKIEPKPLSGDILKGNVSPMRKTEDTAKSVLSGAGLCEITTYSFISPKKYEKMNISNDNSLKNYIEIINPLGEDFSSMRTTLIPNMLETLSKNINRGIKEGKLYESGNIFVWSDSETDASPREISTLCIGMYGNVDFYYLKGIIENLLKKVRVDVEYVKTTEIEFMHPGRTAELKSGDVKIGFLGQIHPVVQNNFEISEKTYIAELDLEKTIAVQQPLRKLAGIPKYPAATRDIAIVVKDEITVGEITQEVSGLDIRFLEKIEFFDLYKGKGIPEDSKSLAFSLSFRSGEKTLNEQEVENDYIKIVNALETRFEAKLR